MTIIPAILPKTRDELIEKLSLLRSVGFTGRVQIDICDGKYVDSKTWPFANELNNTQTSVELMGTLRNDEDLQKLLSDFKIDLDLMVMESESKMMIWNMFHPDRIIIHLDSIVDKDELGELFNLGDQIDVISRKAIVLAFSLDTDIESFSYWYDNFNMRSVQIMGIEHVGHQGQEFSDRTLDYIQVLKARYSDITIMVDGGVSLETVNRLNEYGVAEAVAGSAVFKNDEILNNILELERML